MHTFARALVALALILCLDGFPGFAQAGEQGWTAGKAPPSSHVVAVIKWCIKETPAEAAARDAKGVERECRTQEIVPINHETVSVMECMRGLMMGRAEFPFEGRTWESRGGTCKEEYGPDLGTYLAQKAKP